VGRERVNSGAGHSRVGKVRHGVRFSTDTATARESAMMRVMETRNPHGAKN